MKMKRIVSVITAVAMIAALSTGTAFAGHGNNKNGPDKGNVSVNKQYKEFKDMKGHWGYKSVYKMQKYGIFNGYDDGTFRPDNVLTEAELAVLIERIVDYKLGEDADSGESIVILNTGNNGIGWGAAYNWGPWSGWGTWNNPHFNKVPGWARHAVWRGVFNCYFNPNSFNPYISANRVSAIVAIAKALGLEPETVYTYNPFKDGKLIPDKDLGYVLAMYKEGYISGYPDGSFNPYATLTRAQMATIIEKLLESELVDDEEAEADKEAPTWSSDSKIKAVEVRDTSVDLQWTAAEDNVKVTAYKVLYKLDGANKSKSVTGKRVTISGLEPDQTYTFTVEARDAAGNWSDDGPSVEVTTADEEAVEEDTEAPYWDSGSRITATAITTDSVTLKWSAAKDDVAVTKYKVIYEIDGTEKTKTVTGKTAVIDGLEADTEYTFTVEARDAAGNWSDDGPFVDVTTLEEEEEDTTAPDWDIDDDGDIDESDLQVSAGAGGTVTLIWPDAEDNVAVTAYKIYKDGQLIQTVDSDVNNYIVTGLADDQEYTFKVRAVDAAGNLSSSLTKTYLY